MGDSILGQAKGMSRPLNNKELNMSVILNPGYTLKLGAWRCLGSTLNHLYVSLGWGSSNQVFKVSQVTLNT